MKTWLKSFILLALMLAASGLAITLKPNLKAADQLPKIDLKATFPSEFGDWYEEKQSSAQIVDPETREMLDKIYNQTLSRVYVNANGYRIMLSIAYGGDQSDSMQIHKPEVCYPAQGFELLSKTYTKIELPFGALPVTRIDTRLAERQEPVTYWIRVGDKVVQGSVQKKLVEIRYAITGSVPDGLLFRVSSIDPDKSRAYDSHADFIVKMLNTLASDQRRLFAGSFTNE